MNIIPEQKMSLNEFKLRKVISELAAKIGTLELRNSEMQIDLNMVIEQANSLAEEKINLQNEVKNLRLQLEALSLEKEGKKRG